MPRKPKPPNKKDDLVPKRKRSPQLKETSPKKERIQFMCQDALQSFLRTPTSPKWQLLTKTIEKLSEIDSESARRFLITANYVRARIHEKK